MIRAVDFQYFSSGRSDHMAFLDTVNDRFVEIDGEQVWGTKDELIECVNLAAVAQDKGFIDRLLSLCPLWFLENHEAWRRD